MTAPTAPKHRITIEAAKQVRTLAKPGYVRDLERAAAQGAVPFDNAGAGFPWDIPSEAFDFHLRKLDEYIEQAQHQINQLRSLAQSMRAVAEGHDPSIHEPPPPPEPEPILVATLSPELATATLDAIAESVQATIERDAPEPAPFQMTWTCPDHGLFAEGISRKGRPYRYCPRPECGKLDIMGLPS